ncbi:MAG: serine/threonine protein kinase [Hyalangium sp.]|uniref:serine/threonine protein kinase n=1 Tax=Hyalangium sp. TaxID=2028555 RepID=UPI00389A1EAB
MDKALNLIRPEMLTPGTQVEHWRVLESLGLHAHGALYRVEDVRGPAPSLAMRLSFRRGEGQFSDKVARLQAAHPNMARLHGYGRWHHQGDGFFYCVRDHVQGQSLAHWVETTNPTFFQIAALMGRVASALGDTHARDTWHRDIHPDNIRVRDGDGEPVLMELRTGGNECLDSLVQMPLPQELQVFRSPEELRFQRTNLGRQHACYLYRPTDDLYSLGATAYWLVTGHPPFSPSLSCEQLHTEIELRAPLPPWEVNPRVPKPLGAIILRLLSKLPEARPQNGEVVCAELMVALSAGSRAMWAKRVFDCDEGGLRWPEAPKVCPRPGPRLPRVVHFSPRTERPAKVFEGGPGGAAVVPSEPSEPLSPWARMM